VRDGNHGGEIAIAVGGVGGGVRVRVRLGRVQTGTQLG
jgi:hypothetical protein